MSVNLGLASPQVKTKPITKRFKCKNGEEKVLIDGKPECLLRCPDGSYRPKNSRVCVQKKYTRKTVLKKSTTNIPTVELELKEPSIQLNDIGEDAGPVYDMGEDSGSPDYMEVIADLGSPPVAEKAQSASAAEKPTSGSYIDINLQREPMPLKPTEEPDAFSNTPLETESKTCEEELKTLRNERTKINKDISTKNSDCEDLKYKNIQKYFDLDSYDKKTNKDLLNALLHFYKEHKSNDNDYVLTFQNFIDMFPRDTMKTLKFKRQHVFEAICKLLLVLDYDEGELGYSKKFYSSLEDLIKNPKLESLTKKTILNQSINESSKSGLVDILFETDYKETEPDCWACDCISDTKPVITTRKLVLIQNKYFTEEKTGNKDEYDVSKIYARSNSLNMVNTTIEKEIVLMVNNKQKLDTKITTLSKDLLKSIYGVKEIHDWFRKLLNELYKAPTIDEFITQKVGPSQSKPELKPKFHQSLFTNSTLKYNEEEGYRLFIWGAVPRSGKSYMIGDLISKQKNRLPDEQNNDIVIILGAKTETECQFVKIFANFSNFDDYGIIVASSNIKDTCKGLKRELNKPKDKNIYIFSQEWFKQKKINYNTNQFDDKNVIKKFPSLFNKKRVDLYFDEIHKGGHTDKAENILYAFKNAGVQIDLFVMVTATFAKPNLRYNSTNFIDVNKKKAKIIEWNYEDQQNMKQIANKNEDRKQTIIDSRKKINDSGELEDTVESSEIEDIFEKYKNEYDATTYLDIIAKEYENHPELVLVQPSLINPEKNVDVDTRTVFIKNLKCDACVTTQTIEQLTNPENIFADLGSVVDLLDFIAGKEAAPIVDPKSVYSYLQNIGAPTNRIRQHTELWFLPDKNLYLNPQDCKEKCKLVEFEANMDEEADDVKEGLPNIEPLTRGLAFQLMKHPYFQKVYNVLIVHNTPVKYKKPDGNNWNSTEIFPTNKSIQSTINDDNLSEAIKKAEGDAFLQNKSLIVLTGAKLRLGISLPCADIAFNFDNIKSIDNNYQTMFRVLTERVNQKKSYGYYVDFNKGRAIQFLYDYNNTYGKGKKTVDIKPKTESLYGLMFMFNYNGIGLQKIEDKNLYKTLISELKLDEESYKTYLSKMSTIQSLIKKSIGNLSDKHLQDFKSLVVLNKQNKPSQGNIKKTLKEGITMMNRKDDEGDEDEGNEDEGNEDEGNEDEDEGNEGQEEEREEEGEKDEMSILQDTIAEVLPSIIALLALFSDENNYNCNSLNDCIKKCEINTKGLESVLCSCENDKSIFACYMNPFYNNTETYSQDRLIKLLKLINEILEERENEQLLINLNLIFNTIRDTMGKKTDALIFTMNAEEIQKKIEEYLPIRKEEKDTNGEVFTPSKLIDEMLDKLPKEVWGNPELKWLDPANGIGNFPMIVYKGLMDGLEKTFPNKVERSNHILKKMLYMVEINPKNVKISKKIFGENANIVCGDFLSGLWKNDDKFKGIDTFDIIIGNPPYNKGGVAKGGGVFWKEFVDKSLNLLEENGYLVFIHPTGWRKSIGERPSGGDVWNKFRHYNLLFVKISDVKIKNFPRVDYYVLQKSSTQTDTRVINEFETEKSDERINLYDLEFIPHLINAKVISILRKLFTKAGEKFNIIRNQSFKPTKADETKSGVPHTYFYDVDKQTYTKVFKEYKKDEPEYIKKPKIIITYSNGKKKAYLYPVEYSSKMGSTSNTMYQLTGPMDNIGNIMKLLDSELIHFLLKITQYSEAPNYKNEFKILNMIAKPNEGIIKDDNDVYKYFNLNKEEIEYINSISKSTYKEQVNPPKSASPTTKKRTSSTKALVTKTKTKIQIGGGGNANNKKKTKKQSKMKMPQKTIRRRK